MKTPSLPMSNRTGVKTSPVDAKELVEAAKEFPPTSPGDELGIASVMVSRAADAGPVGSMPPPTSLKQAAKTAVKAVKGERASVFLDKLGERLAFERSGTRLYDGLLAKFDAYGSFDGGPDREELLRFRNQELAHFMLVASAVDRLGGDPTAETPCADVVGVLSKGLFDVVHDPRITLASSLDALLVAELADHDAWESLIELAKEFGDQRMVDDFTAALEQEAVHLAHVRRWVVAGVRTRAHGKERAA